MLRAAERRILRYSCGPVIHSCKAAEACEQLKLKPLSEWLNFLETGFVLSYQRLSILCFRVAKKK